MQSSYSLLPALVPATIRARTAFPPPTSEVILPGDAPASLAARAQERWTTETVEILLDNHYCRSAYLSARLFVLSLSLPGESVPIPRY